MLDLSPTQDARHSPRRFVAAMIAATLVSLCAYANSPAAGEASITITDTVIVEDEGEEAARVMMEGSDVVSDFMAGFSQGMESAAADIDSTSDVVELDKLAAVCIFIVTPVMAILLVWVILAYRNRRNRDRLRYYIECHEKGIPLPPPLPRTPKGADGRQAGIVTLFIGVGVLVFFGFLASWRIGCALGAIPFFIGLAKLINSCLQK